MKYIIDISKLERVLTILSQNEAKARQYYYAELAPRLAALNNIDDKLRIIFTLANADRVSTGSKNIGLVKSTATFLKHYNEKITECKNMSPKSAHDNFFKFLCNIDGMNQKTANLFLKYLVIFQVDFDLYLLDWRSWERFLHVPLDLWVLRLMGKDFLATGSEKYEKDFRRIVRKNKKTNEPIEDYPSPQFTEERYIKLQSELSEIALNLEQTPITLDILWFVGNKYCAYHPLLCHICWLNKECCRESSINLKEMPTEMKEEKRKIRSEEKKLFKDYVNKLIQLYLEENPGQSRNDFYNFIGTPKGMRWRRRVSGR